MIKQLIVIGFLTASLVFSGGVVFAQEAVQNSAGAIQKNQGDVANIRLEAKEAIMRAAQERKDAFLKAQEEFKNRVEAKRIEVKEKIEAVKEQFKERLAKIKDERKKQIVEKLDTRFTEINSKLTKHWEDNLNRLQDLLDKVGSRADKAAVNNVDVSATRAAIASAETAIANARKAVEAQVAKTYPITISTENKLKSDVSSVRTLLNNDLKVVKDAVQAAHKAVVSALVSLKAIPKVNDMVIPSESGESQ